MIRSESWRPALQLAIYLTLGGMVFLWGWGQPDAITLTLLAVMVFWPFVLIYWVASWVLWLALVVFICLFAFAAAVWIWEEVLR